ncbi:DNA-binding response regulator [Deinococcus cellulosilyticus NBRC 106333 = KACC 11606]|uniref:DNA-binding response regulator n=2 Tax=Deinococcus cellulosilyticus TaxID=401558 RepID=A0A511MVR8_DEIC1|nr:DNA-binding response regulator [Deinococcus cellulosilyticus NBRC 106333 = KACC 11606]
MKVILVEDESLFRNLLRTALEQTREVQVLAAHPSSTLTLNDPRMHEADAVVLDIDLGPDSPLNGIQLGHKLREEHPDLGIVLLSNHSSLVFARSLGTDFTGWAYLLKKSVQDISIILRALKSVIEGEVVLDPQLLKPERMLQGPFEHLTPRQAELWGLITQGYTNAAIAGHLGLSQKWIDNAVSGLYVALGLDSGQSRVNPRVAAALLYARTIQHGFLTVLDNE